MENRGGLPPVAPERTFVTTHIFNLSLGKARCKGRRSPARADCTPRDVAKSSEPSPRPFGPPLSRFRRGDEISSKAVISDGDESLPVLRTI